MGDLGHGANMATGSRQVYFGRFIDAPTPSDLRIRTGAVLVSSADGTGRIEKVDWTVTTAEAAQEAFGSSGTAIVASRDGFFFPGFIGKDPLHALMITAGLNN
jgi:hypothetical protein